MALRAQTDDGRHIDYESWGDPQGYPVFLLHGTPGSRLGPRPRTVVLYQLGIHLIAYDRPGYGKSDPRPERAVAHAADDVIAIADAMGLKRFSVVGRSGGGPHALACAARCPERVRSAAVLVSLAPRDAEGLDWFSGMTQSNVREYTKAAESPESFAWSVAEHAAVIRSNPLSLLAELDEELPDTDRLVVADVGIRNMLRQNYTGALEHSHEGWVEDALSFCRPWGFDPASITVPTLLWHGENDEFSPVGHFHWLADHIPGATVVLQPSAAHFAAVPLLPRVLAWLRDNPDPDTPDAARAHGELVTLAD
jgi:pimeloyl-ACP methyl ester carboxylesterase